MTANTPLAGFTILDFTQFYQGPYATFLLAKAGADVIKVEPPGGESLRAMAAPGKEGSFPVAMLNANKRGITLNLKTDAGRDLLRRLIPQVDAVVENYSPGVMDRLGVGWPVLSALNPRLVYATATGFGLSGPDRDNLAMDFTIQAASGVMSLTGMPDGPPLRTGAPYVDILGGATLYGGLVTALLERERTGRGRLVEVAMVEAVYPCLATAQDQYFKAGCKVPARTGNAFANHARAPYNVYPAKDGHVAIILVTETQWQNLLRAMGREDLRDDPRFIRNQARAAHYAETEALVTGWTTAHTRAEIFAATSRYRIPCAPVRELEEVMHDPHMHARGALEVVDHYDFGPVVMPNSPLRFHGADKVPTRVSPHVGEHNEAVYGGMLGLGAAELEALRTNGVI
ncbi:MAG: CoA transferase [Rhodospirillales bacterium 69-11]|nr:CoA transferase [Rhodospirillales bacterium]OJW26559.1 MAG: CoA transferase [Rhodospirillales bacterium 69-11]